MAFTLRTIASGVVAAAALLVVQPADADAQRRDRDLITRDELVNSSQKNRDLYSAVRSLRSHMLQGPRGARELNVTPPAAGSNAPGTLRPSETPKAVLYINGSRSGDIEMMRNVETMHVEEVRYLNPNAAAMQFGPGHEGGAILVKLVTGS